LVLVVLGARLVAVVVVVVVVVVAVGLVVLVEWGMRCLVAFWVRQLRCGGLIAARPGRD
jgi:hypothetical protein